MAGTIELWQETRTVLGDIRHLSAMLDEELMRYSKDIGAPYELVKEKIESNKFSVISIERANDMVLAQPFQRI